MIVFNDVCFQTSNRASVKLFSWSWPCIFLKVVWCGMCLHDLEANLLFFFVPLFASMYACSFPSMLVCALTLYIVMACVRLFNISTIDASMVLSTWLLCWGGCLICVLITYR